MSSEEPIEKTIATIEGARCNAGRLYSKSTKELFAATLEGNMTMMLLEAVVRSPTRGGSGVFESSQAHRGSQNAKARARGLSVLAQLDAGRQTANARSWPMCVDCDRAFKDQMRR